MGGGAPSRGRKVVMSPSFTFSQFSGVLNRPRHAFMALLCPRHRNTTMRPSALEQFTNASTFSLHCFMAYPCRCSREIWDRVECCVVCMCVCVRVRVCVWGGVG